MKPDFALILKQLFPKGEAISPEDTKFHGLLSALAKEFEEIYRVLRSARDSLPGCDGAFSNRWAKIAPASRFKQRPMANTLSGFKALCGPNVKVFGKKAELHFEGIFNEKTSLRCGMTIGKELAQFKRDEFLIEEIERVRHSHVKTFYKETPR